MEYSFFCCRRKNQVSADKVPEPGSHVHEGDFLSRLHPQFLKYLCLYRGKKPLTIFQQIRIENHILYHLGRNDLARAEKNYYRLFGEKASDFRDKLDYASLLASVAENYRDLRGYLLTGIKGPSLTVMQTLEIENYLLPAYEAGNHFQASQYFHQLFGSSALSFKDLMRIFPLNEKSCRM